MSLDIQIGSLGAENDNLKLTMGFSPFFPGSRIRLWERGNRILDPLSCGAEVLPTPNTRRDRSL